MTEFLTHSQCLFTKFRRLFLNVEDRYYSTHDLIGQFYDWTIYDLFYRDTLGQIPWTIHIFPLTYSYVVCQQLKRNTCNKRLETL